MSLQSNLLICATCVHSARNCAGPCACLAVKQELVDIHDRAASGKCPKGFFDNPPETPPIIAAVPRAEWPGVVSYIANTFGNEQDSGFGDTIERIVMSFGGGHIKAMLAAAGVDCGCSDRQKRWNAMYPYKTD